MMSKVTVQARIDPELKAEAEAVFSAIGLSTAEAIRVFLQQSVNSGGLPFQPTAKKANVEPLVAMQELEAHDGRTFQTTEELFADGKR
jgi:DNA-damage-inducible protein J